MTAANPSRRNFLRGKFSEADVVVMRPPGVAVRFDELCTECGKCAEACPESIIVTGKDRRRFLDFSRGSCTFCADCIEACPEDALDLASLSDWNWKAAIGDACLSLQGVTCRACEDACEPRAIRFRPAVGGKPEPNLDMAQCTGCGECSYSCPARAITFAKME